MTENDYPSRSLDRVMVRLPDGMRDRLKQEAETNGRSVNSEIVQRLQSTIDTDELNTALGAVPQDPANHSRSMLQSIRTEIAGIHETLMHYKSQHMWKNMYADDEQDLVVLSCIDRYISDYVKVSNEIKDDDDDTLEGLSREGLIRQILEEWLICQGYAARDVNGAMLSIAPIKSIGP